LFVDIKYFASLVIHTPLGSLDSTSKTWEVENNNLTVKHASKLNGNSNDNSNVAATQFKL